MIRHVLAALVAGSLAVVPATADDDAAPDPLWKNERNIRKTSISIASLPSLLSMEL